LHSVRDMFTFPEIFAETHF